MTTHCNNCGQAVLPDDTKCWHCGAPLAPQQNVVEKDDNDDEGVKWQIATTADGMAIDTLASPTVVYGLVTAVVIVIAFVLLGRLSQPPLLQVAASQIPPNGWSRVTYGDYEFTVAMPDSWEIMRSDQTETATLIKTVTNLPYYTDEVFLPYQKLVDDLEILLLAYDQKESAAEGPFIIIARSQALSDLSYDQAEQLSSEMAAALSYEIFSQEVIDDANKSHFALATVTAHLRCQQQFTTGRVASLLITACAPQPEYVQQREILEEILRSFEYLKRNN